MSKYNKLGLVSWIFLIVFLMSVSFAGAVTDGNLMWHIYTGAPDETTALYDWSGNGYNGINNGATLYSDGYYFDGTNDYIQVDEIEFGHDNFTVCVWSKFSNTGYAGFIGEYNGGGGYREWQLATNPTSLQVSAYSGASTHNYKISSATYKGQFGHFCGQWSGSDHRIYFNGTEITSTSSDVIGGTGLYDASQPVFIGKVSDGTNRWLQGNISSVQVWDEYLTTSDISDLYDEGPYYNPYQINLTITANTYSGYQLQDFNATVIYNGSTYNFDTSTGIITTNISDDEYLANITIYSTSNSSNISQIITNYNISNDITFNYTIVGVEVINKINDTWLAAFNVSTNTSAFVNASSYVGYLYLDTDYYNVTVNAESRIDNSTLLNLSEGYYNHTAYVYTINAFNFTIIDEETNNEITDVLFTIQIVGTSESYINDSVNGTWYVDLITPDDYEIRYFATNYSDDYSLRSKFLTLSPQTYNAVTLYALNSSSTTLQTVIMNVYDTGVSPVEGAIIKVLKADADSPEVYNEVFTRSTNLNGQTSAEFIPINAFYKFQVFYNDELKFASSEPAQIIVDNNPINFFITISNTYYTYSLKVNDAIGDITYTSTGNYTGYFTYTASSSENADHCLRAVYSTVYETSTTESCTTGTAASITINANATNDTYRVYNVYGTAEFTGFEPYTVAQASQFVGQIEQLDWSAIHGLFLLMACIILFFGFSASVEVGVVATGGVLAVLTMPIVGIVPVMVNATLGYTFSGGILALSFIVAWALKRGGN